MSSASQDYNPRLKTNGSQERNESAMCPKPPWMDGIDCDRNAATRFCLRSHRQFGKAMRESAEGASLPLLWPWQTGVSTSGALASTRDGLHCASGRRRRTSEIVTQCGINKRLCAGHRKLDLGSATWRSTPVSSSRTKSTRCYGFIT